MPIHYFPEGRTAAELGAHVERAVRRGDLAPGDPLPAIRAVAAQLGVSPATVASAYRQLGRRGIVAGHGRGGTKVRSAPPLSTPRRVRVPAGVRDLLVGGPDRELLPAPIRVIASPGRYGDDPVLPELRRVAERALSADGLDVSHLAVVGGALDGVERVLSAWLPAGSKVAVEDPGYPATLDLLAAMGLPVVGMAMDDHGVLPDALGAALAAGCDAAVVTPRAQNPTGAAWDERRARQLQRVLSARPDVLVVEDDHAGPVAGTPACTVGTGRARWATIRSVSKWLGPDLRLAVMVGDDATVARVAGRQSLGTGWVSNILQRTAAELWAGPGAARTLRRATDTYRRRREALRRALGDQGLPVTGRSGLTTWVTVDDEHGVTAGLLEAGWAVQPGARFRVTSPPGIRIALSTLREEEAPVLANALARSLRQQPVRTT
jgi:DNA-binding transcriptional MocR family regulator